MAYDDAADLRTPTPPHRSAMMDAIRARGRITLEGVLQRFVLKPLYERVARLEAKPHNHRTRAIDDLADYLVGARAPGDYLEFGVYRGATFGHACHLLGSVFPAMRFVAFDSFEGLPVPRGIDTMEHFYEGQFAATEEDFLETLRALHCEMEKVEVVKGWFDQTLTVGNSYGVESVAAAWIDCDLYESTVPVLRFLTPLLSDGAVILFDDWRNFRNRPDFGQQRACREWLDDNPQIVLRELGSFGWHGVAFTVALEPGQ